MKRTIEKYSLLLVCAVLLISLMATTVFAAGKIDTQRDIKFSVNYADGQKAIRDARFTLYKVADVDEYARMTLTTDFEVYKDSIDGLATLEDLDDDEWSSLAYTLKSYVHRDKLASEYTGRTDDSGNLEIDIKAGLYLVSISSATNADFDTYYGIPFMVLVPVEAENENEWSYEMNVSPKSSIELEPPIGDYFITTYKVLVVWEDEGYENKRPESVKIQLLSNGEFFEEVTLSEENNWRFAWDNLDPYHEWEITESAVDGYVTTIEKKGISFVVTNKFVEPKTESNSIDVEVTGDTPDTPEEFVFVIKPEDESYPMPVSDTVKIIGNGEADFGDIVFEKPGTYVYKISQIPGNTAGYTYDNSEFTVTYTVVQNDAGELEVTKTIVDENGNTQKLISFSNNYKLPADTSKKDDDNKDIGKKDDKKKDNPKKDVVLPQTGLLWWPVPVLFCLGAAFITVGIIRRKKSDEK